MSYYKNGIISIPNVTGDIEITATAVASAPPYQNLIPTSKDEQGNIYNSTGYKNNIYISSDGSEKTDIGNCTTGFIPITKGDKIYVKHGNEKAVTSTYARIIPYNSNKEKIGIYPLNVVENWETYNATTKIGAINTSNLTSNQFPSNTAFFRICVPADGADCIVTVNEPIV